MDSNILSVTIKLQWFCIFRKLLTFIAIIFKKSFSCVVVFIIIDCFQSILICFGNCLSKYWITFTPIWSFLIILVIIKKLNLFGQDFIEKQFFSSYYFIICPYLKPLVQNDHENLEQIAWKQAKTVWTSKLILTLLLFRLMHFFDAIKRHKKVYWLVITMWMRTKFFIKTFEQICMRWIAH